MKTALTHKDKGNYEEIEGREQRKLKRGRSGESNLFSHSCDGGKEGKEKREK